MDRSERNFVHSDSTTRGGVTRSRVVEGLLSIEGRHECRGHDVAPCGVGGTVFDGVVGERHECLLQGGLPDGEFEDGHLVLPGDGADVFGGQPVDAEHVVLLAW